MTDKTCTWSRDPDDDIYESDCGHSFYFVDDDLRGNPDFKWCPYCGLKINPIEPRCCEDCGTDLENTNDGPCCKHCTERRDEQETT